MNFSLLLERRAKEKKLSFARGEQRQTKNRSFFFIVDSTKIVFAPPPRLLIGTALRFLCERETTTRAGHVVAASA